MAPTVALFSPGEMGHAIGRVLGLRGLRAVAALEGRSARTVGLARAAAIEDVGTLGAAVEQADLVLSVLPSAAAKPLVVNVARHLKPDTLFVECNALAPQHVVEIGDLIARAGGRFVDVGIVGGPPTETSSPRFYASGPHAGELLFLRDHGLDVRAIGAGIGQASGLKMCYAALTKGLSALGTELLLAAERLDLLDPLLAELGASQKAQLDWLERAVPGMPPKSRRWVSEMEEIAATLGHLGLESGYHLAAAELFRRVGATPLADEPPEARDTSRTMRTVVEQLSETLPEATGARTST